MTDTRSSQSTPSLAGAMLLLTLVLSGAIVGGLVATRIIGTSGMGWDRLADTLGGLMAGGALGVAMWVVAILTLQAPARRRLMGIAVAAGAGAMVYVLATEPATRVPRRMEIPAPAVAPFSLQIGVADGLGGPPEVGDRLPWTLLRIASNLSLDFTPTGRPNQHCLVTTGIDTPAGIAALTELRARLQAMPTEMSCGEPCPRCVDISLQWFIDDRSAAMTVTDRCWRSHEALQPLRASTEALFSAYRDAAECSTSAP
jgi:hypothetical protein